MTIIGMFPTIPAPCLDKDVTVRKTAMVLQSHSGRAVTTGSSLLGRSRVLLARAGCQCKAKYRCVHRFGGMAEATDNQAYFTRGRHASLEVVPIRDERLETWRVKDRVGDRQPSNSPRCLFFGQMKTTGVALVVCLNLGIDPPDVVKPQPCARLQCWVGASSFPSAGTAANIT